MSEQSEAERRKRRNKNPSLPTTIRAIYDWDCVVCGQIHERLKCQGHALQLDENENKIRDPKNPNKFLQRPCRQNPLPGSRYCTHHCDQVAKNTGQLAEIEAKYTADARILQMLHDPTAKPVENVAEEFAKMVGILRNAFHQAGERVNRLNSVSIQTAAGGEQLRGEVILWERLIHHLRSALVDMARLGIEERRARMDEIRGNKLASELHDAVTEFSRRAVSVTGDDIDLLNELIGVALSRLVES